MTNKKTKIIDYAEFPHYTLQ